MGTLPEDFPFFRLTHIPIDSNRGVCTMPWGTEIPLAPFFGIIATAATVLCIFVFLLAGLALARATRGLRRAAGLATAALFAILLAGQPVDTLLLSAVALLSTFAFSAFAVARLRAHAFS